MAEEIRSIHRQLGTTFIYVTHDRDEAMILADRVLCRGEPLGTPGMVGFSPAALVFEPPTEEHVALRCTMTDRLFLGERIQVTLSVGTDELIAHVPTLSGFEFERNKSVTAYIPKSRIIPLAGN
jgi:ABC-type sugar transport system ATPase subunit